MQRDHLLDEILLIADADPNPKRARVRIDDRPLKLASRLHGPCGATHGRGLFPLAVLLRRQLTEQPFSFIVNVSKDKAIEAAAAAYIPNGQVTIPFSPMIINTGSKLIAIDTGNGLGAFASSKGVVGQARVFHSASA